VSREKRGIINEAKMTYFEADFAIDKQPSAWYKQVRFGD